MAVNESFYVYEHIRKDSFLPFYVGKGKDNRAYRIINRNKYWRNIVNKCNGFDVRFIVKDVDEELAFLVEKERIHQLKLLNIKLCNLTNGGDGVSGYKFTDEQRQKMSLSRTGKKLPEDQVERITKLFRTIERTEEWCKNISNSLKNVPKTKETIKKISESKTKYVFCIDENKLFRSAEIASKYYGIHKSAITRACNGSRKKANKMNWRYAEQKDLECFHLTQT